MLIFSVVFLTVFYSIESAKILGVFPTPSVSHQVVYQSIWKELSLRGHQVTVLTPNPLHNASLTNLTEIDMASTYDVFRGEYIGEHMAKDNYALGSLMWYLNMIEVITQIHFKKTETFLKNPETKFDLILVETLHPLVYSLGCRFKVPFIGVSSFGLFLQTHDAMGNPTHPIIGPDTFENIMDNFTLYEKMCSLLNNWICRFTYYWYILPKNDQIAKKFWGQNCPYLGDLERNVSLILVNTNPVLHFARPFVANIVEMGQMHIRPKQALPQDIQNYLDLSHQGVVYISLGTNVRSANLSPNMRRIMVETAAELPYNVLWKWETDDFPDKPKNVMIRKWLPQQNILGHKNLKVFVTQGGLQSLEEAISNSVPIVGIPFIADQPKNVMKVVELGVGRSINHVTVTKKEFKEVVMDVAENERYRQKIKELKDLFSDQSMTGLERSVWWIEYVLRHKRTKHLTCPAANMSQFEYFFLDIATLLIISFLILIYSLFLLYKIIIKIVKRYN